MTDEEERLLRLIAWFDEQIALMEANGAAPEVIGRWRELSELAMIGAQAQEGLADLVELIPADKPDFFQEVQRLARKGGRKTEASDN